MLTQERKAHILQVLRRDKRVVAKAVSRELGLSEDTIRRDLRELAAEGRLQRVHGGALPASPAVADFTQRRQVSSEGKAAVGRRAARLIQPGQIAFLDGGTTAVQVARHLAPDIEATIVTHSPSVAVELTRYPGVTIEMIGGRLFKHSVVTVGTIAATAIAGIRPDLYLMGVTGIHPAAGLTTGDADEAAIKRLISRQSAETVVLASREKLETASPFLVMPASEADALVVEPDLPEDTLAPFRRLGLAILTG
jgi:DeoR/GlpR family transcriptional regulator of sugar metabolism